MENLNTALSQVTPILVLVSWFVFALFFLFRKREKHAVKTKRDSASWIGVTIVALGYSIIWSVRRQMFTPLFENMFLNILSELSAIIIAIISIGFILSALQVLGKQWNVEATLVQEHKLITNGVYSIVRNPIYTGMLGMMLATGIAFSYPLTILIGVTIGLLGTIIRIRREEQLLLTAFGEDFRTYCKNVPALLPYLLSRK